MVSWIIVGLGLLSCSLCIVGILLRLGFVVIVRWLGSALLLNRMVVICILGQVGRLLFGGWLFLGLILWIRAGVLCRGYFVIVLVLVLVVMVVMVWVYFIGGVATSIYCSCCWNYLSEQWE